MGWWENADGALIGDEAADVAHAELAALSDELVARRGRRLALDELLGYLCLVLRTKARDLLAPGETPTGLTAELDIHDEDRHEFIAMAAPTDNAIRDRIDAMCARISQQYDAVLDRRPRVGEILATIRFVLGHRAARLLEVPPSSRVLAIAPGAAS